MTVSLHHPPNWTWSTQDWERIISEVCQSLDLYLNGLDSHENIKAYATKQELRTKLGLDDL